ncbi:hypothetical protein [Pseudomonas sp. TWRC1-2]|uniref:hypothetical protein n=1 Tax=Pseudomonas sp. TWRC1-2 TaxID=2804628 RepID=UPI003CF468EE
MTESPYVTHRETLLEGKYGTAYLLQQFILHQYAPYRYSFEIDDHRGGFDSRHLQMYQDMKQCFWENGRSSDGFMELAETIETRCIRQAEANRDELVQLREMRPEDYPHDNGTDQLESYKSAIVLREMHHKRYVEKGFLDE